jgi:hypothetical protein
MLDPGTLRSSIFPHVGFHCQLPQWPTCLVNLTHLAAKLSGHQQTEVPGILRWEIFKHD